MPVNSVRISIFFIIQLFLYLRFFLQKPSQKTRFIAAAKVWSEGNPFESA